MTATTARIVSEREGHVGRLLIDNPSKRNALSADMWLPLATQLKAFDADDDIRVVIIKGAGGKIFASGGDLSEASTSQASMKVTYGDVLSDMWKFRKPLIAQIGGYCLGGGVAVAMQADFRIGSTEAVMGIPAAKLGRVYGYELVADLIALVGHAQARKLLLVGDHIDAKESYRIGLLDVLVSPEKLDETVEETARTIAANAPLSVRGMKRIIQEVLTHPGEGETEAAREAVADCLASRDVEEGRVAFMERRPAKFTGS